MKRLLLSLIILASTAAAFGQRSQCFPFEELPPEKRRPAEEMLLKALDSEALYTIAGDLKPMSSGFAQFQVDVRAPKDAKKAEERAATLRKIDDANEILAHFRCGDNLFATMQVFARAFDGKRYTEAVVFNRRALSRAISDRREFFDRWAVTSQAHPLQVLSLIENDQTGARFAGYGYLFGYPDYAVRFFVQAAAEEDLSGKFVERDFYSIPTFASATNRFVYAVPKGHAETDADRELKARAMRVFEEYKRRRGMYIGDGKKGVVEMMRDWLCANASCGPG